MADLSSTERVQVPRRGDLDDIRIAQLGCLTLTTLAPITVTGTSGTLLAAAAAGTRRYVRMKIMMNADTGIFTEYGGGAATNRHPFEPGETEWFRCDDAIAAIRAGSSNVTVYVTTGALV